MFIKPECFFHSGIFFATIYVELWHFKNICFILMSMNDIDKLTSKFELFKKPGSNQPVRLLTIFSAVMARGEFDYTVKTIRLLKEAEINEEAIYETMLQSYLFLGFPRMIEAGLAYNKVFGDLNRPDIFKGIESDEANKWFSEGQELCRTVYGKNYKRLKDKFLAVSPEIFRWMVNEGYGKVLSRPGLTHIERELCEVAALIYEKRERQLVSHIMGSLNVGATTAMIARVNEDIHFLIDDDNYKITNALINKITDNYEATK